ncbi:MAG: FecR family protein [Elusimicrobiales bacterium]|nr:FecR family protein [Elusimicrobiales bacterium]
MRTKILSFFLLLALPGVILAGEAKLLSLSGAVEVRPAREGQWTSATESMEIAEGGGIRTAAGGQAVLLMPNKSKIWLKENSSLEIEQRQTLASRLALVFGKIKVRVPHLMRKEKFEVRTPVAVCAVRGTEFVMGADESGKMDLQVLFGEVKFKFTVPPAKGPTQFSIPQGQGLTTAEEGKANKPVLLTAKAEREAMENWNPGLKPEERQKELQQKENDRAQIKDFARATTSAENAVKAFTNVVKESDLEAGRTLTDVHGNVVRVDQRMMRPEGDTIQFFNIVKRPNYADFTGREFSYNGGAQANRLDLMQMSMKFDKALPARIEEWPSFFNSNTINPVYASFITANRTNRDEIFVIAEGYRYDAARDELVDNLSVIAPSVSIGANSSDDRHTIITGVLADEGTAGHAQDMLNAISRLEIRDTAINSGTHNSDGATTFQYKNSAGTYVNMNTGGATDVLWAMNMSPATGVSSWSQAGDPQLYQYQADPYAIGNKTVALATDYIFYARENYVINNGGQIQQVSDFTNSSQDPFTILKNSGAETITYIKKSNGDYVNAGNTWATEAALRADINNTATGDRFSYSAAYGSKKPNIDAVFIPDLMIAAVQRMLPAITNLGN